mmetsp:Transcript_43816/g.126576  ORF Transcript_43816/g.126576 Transcript_43816/m.126576 type:complete len:436 (-) Transcript_43816:27-1334(-)
MMTHVRKCTLELRLARSSGTPSVDTTDCVSPTRPLPAKPPTEAPQFTGKSVGPVTAKPKAMEEAEEFVPEDSVELRRPPTGAPRQEPLELLDGTVSAIVASPAPLNRPPDFAARCADAGGGSPRLLCNASGRCPERPVHVDKSGCATDAPKSRSSSSVPGAAPAPAAGGGRPVQDETRGCSTAAPKPSPSTSACLATASRGVPGAALSPPPSLTASRIGDAAWGSSGTERFDGLGCVAGSPKSGVMRPSGKAAWGSAGVDQLETVGWVTAEPNSVSGIGAPHDDGVARATPAPKSRSSPFGAEPSAGTKRAAEELAAGSPAQWAASPEGAMKVECKACVTALPNSSVTISASPSLLSSPAGASPGWAKAALIALMVRLFRASLSSGRCSGPPRGDGGGSAASTRKAASPSHPTLSSIRCIAACCCWTIVGGTAAA